MAPKIGTLDARIQKRRTLFVANIPLVRWIWHMFDANITFMTTFGNCSFQDHFVAILTSNLHRNWKFFKFIFWWLFIHSCGTKDNKFKEVFWGTLLPTHQLNILPWNLMLRYVMVELKVALLFRCWIPFMIFIIIIIIIIDQVMISKEKIPQWPQALRPKAWEKFQLDFKLRE